MLEQYGYQITEIQETEQTHRHKDSFCEGISRRWENHHYVCEIRRQGSRHIYQEYKQYYLSETPRKTSLGQESGN